MTPLLLILAGIAIGTIATARPASRTLAADRRARTKAWDEVIREHDRAAEMSEHARRAAHEASLDAFNLKAKARAARIADIKRMMGERS